MNMTLKTLLRHAVASINAPRDQARWVMSIDLTRQQRWQALVAVSVLSTVLTVLIEFIKTGQATFLLGLVTVNPFVGAIATVSNAIITVFIIYWAGRAFGGHGRFPDVISIVAWLQFILTCILAAQLVILLALPPFLAMTDVVALVAIFYLFSHFVAELHGFRSALNVFLVMIAVSAAFVIGLYMLAGMAGLAISGA